MMWEYLYRLVPAHPDPAGETPESVTAWLDAYGRGGWELVNIDGFAVVFKRPSAMTPRYPVSGESPTFETECGSLLAGMVRAMQRPMPPAQTKGRVGGADGHEFDVIVRRVR